MLEECNKQAEVVAPPPENLALDRYGRLSGDLGTPQGSQPSRRCCASRDPAMSPIPTLAGP